MAKDTFYFSHDYNARNDQKIKGLIKKHGMSGYGVWWAIVEELYNNANALRLDYEGIAYDLRSDGITVKSVIHDFDLFVIDGEIFGSVSIERRISERNSKSLKARESANKRWEKMRMQCELNANASKNDAIKESKGKEIKENKEIKEDSQARFNFKKSLVEYGFSEKIVDDWLKVRKTKKLTGTETAYEQFISEIEKRACNLNETLALIVSKSWGGFKWEWVDNLQKNGTGTSKQGKKAEFAEYFKNKGRESGDAA